MIARHLVVMLKEPRVGRVKTRLARDIGAVDATWWFRHQTRALLRRMQDPRWFLTLAVSPDRSLDARCWPARLPRLAQGRGDLGDRMRRALRGLPKGPVCLIGGDIPGVRKAHIAQAFHLLGAHDAVVGPTFDGGYWLIGLRHPHRMPPALFQGVRWSSAYALQDTLAGLEGLSVGMATRLCDVDRARDLTALHMVNKLT